MIAQGEYAVVILDENGLEKSISDGVYVSLTPPTTYSLQLRNNSTTRCTVYVSVEGREIGAYAVNGCGGVRVIDGLFFPRPVHNTANSALDGLLTITFACEPRPLAYHEKFYPQNTVVHSRSSGALFSDNMFNIRLVSSEPQDNVNILHETAWRGSLFH